MSFRCEPFRVARISTALFALLAISALVAIGSANPAQAAFPGEDGRIVFATDRDGNSEIYSMAADGSDVQRLTNNPASDRDPAISPDGSRIAFTSDRDGDDEIFVMDIDGEAPANLTNNTDADRQPTWAPDGSQIAFATDRHANADGFEIWVMSDTGASPVRRTPNGNNQATDSNPTWSPDGSRIAFDRFIAGTGPGQGGGEIYVMNSTGGGQVNLTDNIGIEDRGPDFSPTVPNQIVFESNRGGDFQIYTLEPGGGGFQVTQRSDDPANATDPVFAPSGDRVSFVSDRDGNPEVYALDLGDDTESRLTDDAAADISPAWQAVEPETPPEVNFDSAPAAATNSTEATFEFSSDTGTSVECRLDSTEEAGFEECSSPVVYDLDEGQHKFEVRATDGDGVTGVSEHIWTIDLTDPETTITKAPEALSTDPVVQFEFTSNEPGSSFECRLDSDDEADFSSCASPKNYAGLSSTAHSFEVRAIDAAGNIDSTPASHDWELAVPPPPESSTLSVKTVSSRADMVSDGNSLIEIELPNVQIVEQLTVTHEGLDITDDLEPVDIDPTRLRVLIEGLPEGPSLVTAEIPGYPQAQLILVDHPRTGPVFSGPHQEPFICQTVEYGVGEPIDEDCSVATQYSYMYRDNSNAWVPLADPTAPYPGDGQYTTTTDGKTVPYAIRIERGTINRAIYSIAVLVDVGPGTDQSRPGEGWNQKLLFNFGGGCKAGYTQGEPDTYAPTNNVGNGYATAESSLNVFANRCSDAVSAETLSMIKEHFTEQYGEPRFTIGTGGSGGAMAQYMINDNYPGLLDGSTVSHSFVDNAYAANSLMDCRAIDLYLTEHGAGWTNAQKNAVKGPKQNNGCAVLWAGFGRNFFNPSFCPAALPAELIYHAVNNPGGTRCTITDGNIAVWGTDPETGFARMPVDNVGVTYGLEAFRDGVISAEQFVHLNENTGAINHDNQTLSTRIEASDETLRIAYEKGQIISGGAGLSFTPMIDNRSANNDNQATNPHHIVHALSVRERIVRANGDAGTHVIWTSPNGGVGNVVATMDEWLEGIAADQSERPARAKALDARPDEATDRCFNGDGTLLAVEPASYGSGVCGQAYPSYGLPRFGAGAPLANDVLKCELKPIDFSEYPPLTEDQQQRLTATFPEGVCDFSKPGVEQFISRETWRVYPSTSDPDLEAPETAIGSVPPSTDAPGNVEFGLSANETGARFECRVDGAEFESCELEHRLTGLADGEHVFEARATDIAGNVDPTPASVTFRVGAEPVEEDPVLAISAGSHDFGKRTIGDGPSPTIEFELRNEGGGEVNIGQLEITGPHAADFSSESDVCSGKALAAGTTCSFAVRFAPTGTGERTATVKIASDLAGAPDSIALSGSGEARRTDPPPKKIKPRAKPLRRVIKTGRAGRASLPIHCRARQNRKCRGRLILKIRKRALGIKARGWKKIATKKYQVRPGKSTVRFRIIRRATRSLIRRRGKAAQVKLKLTTNRNGGRVAVNRRVKLRLK